MDMAVDLKEKSAEEKRAMLIRQVSERFGRHGTAKLSFWVEEEVRLTEGVSLVRLRSGNKRYRTDWLRDVLNNNLQMEPPKIGSN